MFKNWQKGKKTHNDRKSGRAYMRALRTSKFSSDRSLYRSNLRKYGAYSWLK